MLARKCDACEKYYDHYDGCGHYEASANGFIFIDRDLGDYWDPRERYDLCPTCMSVVINILDVLRTTGESGVQK